jgi:hypothetical protein
VLAQRRVERVGVGPALRVEEGLGQETVGPGRRHVRHQDLPPVLALRPPKVTTVSGSVPPVLAPP